MRWPRPGALRTATRAVDSAFSRRPSSAAGGGPGPGRAATRGEARAGVHRTQTYTLAFAAAAMALIAASAVVTYLGVRDSFERDFTRRLADLAELTASQVGPDDLEDVRLGGPESTGWLSLQVQFESLRSSTNLLDVSVVDNDRRVLFDVREPDERRGLASRMDTVASALLDTALAGRAMVSPPYLVAGRETRAAMAPVREGAATVAVLVAEAQPAWEGELARLRQRLALVALLGMLAAAALAAVLVRAIGSQLALEQRLSRSENLAAMGRLTATLAHEIKNPLAIIRGSAKRLGKLAPDAQRMADSVVEEVDRLTGTVGRYLQFARGGGPSGSHGDAALALRQTLDLLEGEFQARRAVLVREVAEDGAWVRLDADSLKQAWLNLVLNALEAVAEGGTVRVRAEVVAGRFEAVVEDDGPGFPPEVLRRLGEPFRTTKAQGSGLGLFLCRRLAEGAGGALAAANRRGGGASVRLTLPLAATAAGANGR